MTDEEQRKVYLDAVWQAGFFFVLGSVITAVIGTVVTRAQADRRRDTTAWFPHKVEEEEPYQPTHAHLGWVTVPCGGELRTWCCDCCEKER